MLIYIIDNESKCLPKGLIVALGICLLSAEETNFIQIVQGQEMAITICL